MSRIPLDLALAVTHVQLPTLRRWVREGCVTRFPDGSFDYEELIAHRDSRDVHCLAARAGVKHPERVGVSLGGQ